MIQHEEFLFEESFAVVKGLIKPEPPLVEEFDDLELFQEAENNYGLELQKYTVSKDKLLSASIESGDIPNGVIGLIPDGSDKVNWRWTGEIFEEDSQGILNNSIVVRNLQELGVDSIEALKYLFPSKTDEERAAMLTGFPFRMVQQSQQAFNTFVSMIGQLYQLPHPQIPNQPLAADPNLDITGFLYRSLDFLRKELSYSGKYKPNDGERSTSKLSDADRKRSELGLPTRDERPVQLPGSASGSPTGTNGLPANGGPAGFGGPGSSSESLAGGVPGTQRKPEYASSIPGPGVVLGVSDSDNSGQYPGNLGFTAPAMGPAGSADIRSASFNPGLYTSGAQPNPAFGGSTAVPATGSGSGSVPKSRSKRGK
tara:strand:- start:275 stop:1381 length:1107 start_codon:yes stop_codon:yes gene_type:complete